MQGAAEGEDVRTDLVLGSKDEGAEFGMLFKHTTNSNDKVSLIIMITPYIVKRSEDLSKLRYALGRLDLIEKNLADELEQNLETGKQIEINPELLTPELTHKEITQTQIVKPVVNNSVEILIDENGRAFRIQKDAQGNVVSKTPTTLDESY